MLRNFFQIVNVIYTRVAGGHSNNFIVNQSGIYHLHISQNGCLHKAQRMYRLGTHHQNIERIAILSQRLRNEAIINRIVEGRINNSRQDLASLFALSISYFDLTPWGFLSTIDSGWCNFAINSHHARDYRTSSEGFIIVFLVDAILYPLSVFQKVYLKSTFQFLSLFDYFQFCRLILVCVFVVNNVGGIIGRMGAVNNNIGLAIGLSLFF